MQQQQQQRAFLSSFSWGDGGQIEEYQFCVDDDGDDGDGVASSSIIIVVLFISRLFVHQALFSDYVCVGRIFECPTRLTLATVVRARVRSGWATGIERAEYRC